MDTWLRAETEDWVKRTTCGQYLETAADHPVNERTAGSKLTTNNEPAEAKEEGGRKKEPGFESNNKATKRSVCVYEVILLNPSTTLT